MAIIETCAKSMYNNLPYHFKMILYFTVDVIQNRHLFDMALDCGVCMLVMNGYANNIPSLSGSRDLILIGG